MAHFLHADSRNYIAAQIRNPRIENKNVNESKSVLSIVSAQKRF